MVSFFLVCVGMDQSGQRTSVDHQPWNESSKLLRREQVDLKHADWMRSKRSIPDPINSEFGDYCKCQHFARTMEIVRTLSPYTFPKLSCELQFFWLRLQEVDVNAKCHQFWT
jgi:hypothetical protein